MSNVKKFMVLAAVLLAAAVLLQISYGIWRHDAEVGFRLTITRPADGDCECCNPGTYTTIQEGIDLLKNKVYNCIYNKMESFKSQLNARITELENLPFGGITFEELSAEVKQYREVDIARFGRCITKYGSYINELAQFYRNSPKEEKDKVPNFWDQYDGLWLLSDQLWYKRDELYDVVDDLWAVGESKIDYNKGSKEKDKDANINGNLAKDKNEGIDENIGEDLGMDSNEDVDKNADENLGSYTDEYKDEE